MQVRNDQPREQIQPVLGRPLELKQGEVYHVQIKERGEGNEATVTLRGKEIKVQFDGDMPKENRVAVQITGQSDQAVKVKAIAERPQKKAIDVDAVLKTFSGTDQVSPELKQATEKLLDAGLPLTKETVRDVQSFLQTAKGTMEQKLDTITALANKQIQPTAGQLAAVHVTLHGEPLNDVLTNLAKAIDPSFTPVKQKEGQSPLDLIREVKDQVAKEPNVQKAIDTVKQEIVSNPKVPKEVAEQVDKALKEVQALKQVGREVEAKVRLTQALGEAEKQAVKVEQQRSTQQPEPKASEIVREVKEQVVREPNVQKAIDTVKQEIVNNPKVPKEVAEQVEKALKEVQALKQVGREVEAKVRLTQALNEAEKQSVKVEQQRPSPQQPEPKASEIVREVKEQVVREPNVQKAIDTVKQEIVNNPKVPKEVAEQVEKALKEVQALKQVGREVEAKVRLTQALNEAEKQAVKVEQQRSTQQPERKASEIVREVKEQVVREPNIQKALDTVRQEIVNNPKVPKEITDQVEKALKDIQVLNQIGRVAEAKTLLTKTLETVETQLAKGESQPQQSVSFDRLKQQLQNEPNMKQAIEQVEKQLGENRASLPKEVVEKLTRVLSEAKQLADKGLDAVSRNQLMKGLNEAEAQLAKVDAENQKGNGESFSNERQALKERALSSNDIKKVLDQFQKEPNLAKALKEVKQQLLGQANLEQSAKEKVTEALESAMDLHQKGRELKARTKVAEALETVEKTIAKHEPAVKAEPSQVMQQEMNEWTKMVQSFTSKDIVVTTVTKKMSQAAIDFKQFKRDMMKNLDSVDHLIKQYRNNAIPQAKQMLESTIKTLDKEILNSDMMLLTDMKTEKKLIQASGQLADAKKKLTGGDLEGAQKIVREVKDMLEKLQFKPSDVKVKHFVKSETENAMTYSPKEQVMNYMNNVGAVPEYSARSVYESIRSLGLNHDREIAQSLVFGEEQKPTENMKAALMQLAEQNEKTNPVVKQFAEQAVANVTGQQLLSKSDNGSNLQSLFFNLPLVLNEQARTIQVYVNSRNEGQQVDWENCNLYFLLETKKLGDVGILLTSVDRNLSLTIKNDRPDFKAKMEPLVDRAKEGLKEIGYNVGSIQFATLTAPTNKEMPQTKTMQETKRPPIFTEKGFDFTI